LHNEIRSLTLIPYETSIEEEMRKFYNTLSEKDKRRYAAIEAMKLGHGGIVYMAQVLGCSRMTITQGVNDLEELPVDSEYEPRIRQLGAGRKRYDEVYPDIDQKFLDVLQDYTAGDLSFRRVTEEQKCKKTLSGRI